MKVSSQTRDRLFDIYGSGGDLTQSKTEPSILIALLKEAAQSEIESLDQIIYALQTRELKLTRSLRKDVYADRKGLEFFEKYLTSLEGADAATVARAIRPIKHIGFFNENF
mgnify:CR=1 FL=1